MTPGTHADLVARLRKFVAEYRKIQRLDPEMVYALHSEHEERFAPLRLSDLAAAADALAALPPPADPPKVCPECGDPLSCIACEAKEDARPEWRTSFGWMIEARFSGVPHWFEGIGGNSSGSTYLWTTDPARGIRLCRREDVVALIDSLNEGAPVPMRGYPSQHGWCDLRPEIVTPIGAHAPADPPALVGPPAPTLTAFQREARDKLRTVLANYNLLDATHGLGRDVDEAVRWALGALADPTPTDPATLPAPDRSDR